MSTESSVLMVSSLPVVGRFAPSPTGDLHLGSLVAAVASYLAAKAAGGKWLLRIEDLDPLREVPGAGQRIIKDLARFGFEWDGEIIWQSRRYARYASVLKALQGKGLVYPCTCSRREIAAAGLRGVDGFLYPGWCRSGDVKSGEVAAWRLRVPDGVVGFEDGIQGWQSQDVARDVGDFVLCRADGCWAYQLAVVVDDADSGVNQIVRGADLLDSTPRQIVLWQLLGWPVPKYVHVPVIVNSRGEKLSKQTLAKALGNDNESMQLCRALNFLSLYPPREMLFSPLSELWVWAINNWNLPVIPRSRVVSE